MAVITPPSITVLPAPPDPASRSTFNALAYPWSAALPTMNTQVKAVADNVALNATDAQTSATNATTQASNALASANASAQSSNATIWVTGTTYAIGDVRFSPINFTSYRRKTIGAGVTDPSLDDTNWAILSVEGFSLAQAHATALSF